MPRRRGSSKEVQITNKLVNIIPPTFTFYNCLYILDLKIAIYCCLFRPSFQDHTLVLVYRTLEYKSNHEDRNAVEEELVVEDELGTVACRESSGANISSVAHQTCDRYPNKFCHGRLVVVGEKTLFIYRSYVYTICQ